MWGLLGANVYVPFPHAYYLIRVRPLLASAYESAAASDVEAPHDHGNEREPQRGMSGHGWGGFEADIKCDHACSGPG